MMRSASADIRLVSAQAQTWSRVLLDSVAVRGSGHTPNKKHPEYWGGDVPWVSLKDTFRLDRGAITETTDTITAAGLTHSSAVMHSQGSVVLLRDAGIGKSGIIGADMAVSQHFMAWRCGARLDNWFLYYYFQRMKPEFDRISNGSTIKTIGLDYFKQLTVPLPAIEEQRSISLVLREADDLISTLGRLVAKKHAIKQGMMQQLLTGHTRIGGFAGPWLKTPLGAISAFITKGSTPTTYGFRWESTGVPFLRSECVSEHGLDMAQSMFISNAANEALRRSQVTDGDILMTITGNVGRVIRLAGIGDANINQHIARVRIKDPQFDDGFVYHYLSQRAMREYYESIVTGQAYPQISLKQVRDTEIPAPPIEEQRAIASALGDVDDELTALRARLDKARAVKTGMMQQLLTGRTRLPVEVAS